MDPTYLHETNNRHRMGRVTHSLHRPFPSLSTSVKRPRRHGEDFVMKSSCHCCALDIWEATRGARDTFRFQQSATYVEANKHPTRAVVLFFLSYFDNIFLKWFDCTYFQQTNQFRILRMYSPSVNLNYNSKTFTLDHKTQRPVEIP